MNLPEFRYHPDPIKTGSLVASENVCVCCDQSRGYIYTGPAFCADELSEALCPWCIADGSAHQMFDVEFSDAAGVGGYVPRIELPAQVIDEVCFRTPGFSGWQQEHWLACCGDAAAFLGIAGKQELETTWPEAIEAVRLECGYNNDEWANYYASLRKDAGPTAYIFQCLHCSNFLAYSDCH